MKANKELIDKYINYMKENHTGKENGISRERLRASMGVELAVQKAVLSTINNNPEYDFVVSTCGSIYLCTTPGEVKLAAMNEIRSGLSRLNKGKRMLKKLDLHGQLRVDNTDEGFEVTEII